MASNPYESIESSSPIITRAVAAGLQGNSFNTFEFPAWQRAALKVLGVFPQGAGRFMITRTQGLSGLPPGILKNFRLKNLIQLRLNDYANVAGKFRALTLGVGMGGATSYLSLSLGGPFLPQTFVISVRGGSPDGNVNTYLDQSLDAALQIASDNPELMTIQHYDPIHDGWFTRTTNHLRFKLLTLPEIYKDFIRERLEPGGDIVFLDGQASWLRYRLGERSFFQVGGWGHITAEEFLNGSERIWAYCRKAGLKFSDWRLEEFPLERGPESEWGAEPGLAEALKIFCEQEGYNFIPIQFSDPNGLARMAYKAARILLEKENRDPAGVLIEMFTQFDSVSARNGSLLPLWLIFNTLDSLEFLKEMRSQFPVDKPVFFSPLATFSHTPDLVPWVEWEVALSGLDWRNIGTRKSHYPGDTLALLGWSDPLREWVSKHHQPIISYLSGTELATIANELSQR